MEKIDYLMKIPTRKYKYDSLDKVLEVIREDIDNFHNYRCEWGTRNQGKSLSSTKDRENSFSNITQFRNRLSA